MMAGLVLRFFGSTPDNNQEESKANFYKHILILTE